MDSRLCSGIQARNDCLASLCTVSRTVFGGWTQMSIWGFPPVRQLFSLMHAPDLVWNHFCCVEEQRRTIFFSLLRVDCIFVAQGGLHINLNALNFP